MCSRQLLVVGFKHRAAETVVTQAHERPKEVALGRVLPSKRRMDISLGETSSASCTVFGCDNPCQGESRWLI